MDRVQDGLVVEIPTSGTSLSGRFYLHDFGDPGTR